LKIAARADARVGATFVDEPAQRVVDCVETRRLHDDRPVPVEPEPLEVTKDPIDGAWHDPRRVEILDPEDDSAAAGAGVPPCEEKSASMTDV
jgi:hypothetical protein